MTVMHNNLLRLVVAVICVSTVFANFQVTIDLSSDRHPVSDGVYGVNGIPADMLTERLVGATRMGGGDPTTVYNWRIDADNAGYDWYFSQRPRAAEGQNSADNFVAVTSSLTLLPSSTSLLSDGSGITIDRLLLVSCQTISWSRASAW